MAWADIWKIIMCAIASAGGVGAIIVCAVKFSADRIADRLSKKYEAKMQKEVEKYKSGLDNKIYISKAKFDTEFSLYRELSRTFFEMVKDITIMIPSGYATYPADKEERKTYENNLYDKAAKSTFAAQGVLNSNIPFIPENLYEKYEEIIGLCRVQLGVFEDRWNVLYFASQEEKETFSGEDYHRSREISKKFKELNLELRDYLAKLDILE